VISRLDDDPEYGRLAALRRALMTAREARQNGLDILGLEGELARPGGSARGPRGEEQRKLLERLRRTLPAPPLERPDPAGLPPTLRPAMQLLRGETVEGAPDRQARLQRLRDEHRLLDDAERVVSGMMDEVRQEHSAAVCREQAVRHAEILRSYFSAAQAMAAALDMERHHIAEVIVSGHDPRPDILFRPGMIGALRLGSLTEHDSEISTERRRLEMLGVL